MSKTRANGIDLEYETFGDKNDPAMLLVMGFSLQMISWDDAFCKTLADKGFYVVRFDNRDVGLSTKMEGMPLPNLPAIFGGDMSSVAYSLGDMAKDAIGLLDALAISSAHVVGLSMGGMIAQRIAIEYPTRVASLCSIMSTTGDRSVGHATPEALGVVMTPAPATREEFVEQSVALWRVLSSKSHPLDEAGTRERAARGFDRSYYPLGAARQLAAILSAADRTPDLKKLDLPALVIHGEDDPLIQPSGGEATARAIPRARMLTIAKMGHELPPRAWPIVIDAITENAARARA